MQDRPKSMKCCGEYVDCTSKDARYRHRKKFRNCKGWISSSEKRGPKEKKWTTQEVKTAHIRQLAKERKAKQREKKRDTEEGRKAERRRKYGYKQ